MIILGIDPGIATTGFGVVQKTANKLKHLENGAILTSKKYSLSQRLNQLYQSLSTIIGKYTPDAMAVEELFFGYNTTTALTVAHARGVILLSAEAAQLPVYHYKPTEVKLSVCGYGHASKHQMIQMVTSLLNISTRPKPDDAADGLAVAICHGHSHKLKSYQ